MSPSLQPLMALLAQTENERDQAMAAVQQAARGAEAAQQQCEQLVAYRREYEQRFSAQFKREGGMELVHCYHGFMERLTLAIDQQQRVAQQAAGRLEAMRQTLREQELRVASVRKLIERREHELRLQTDRREQRQTDEFALRVALARSVPGADTASFAR